MVYVCICVCDFGSGREYFTKGKERKGKRRTTNKMCIQIPIHPSNTLLSMYVKTLMYRTDIPNKAHDLFVELRFPFFVFRFPFSILLFSPGFTSLAMRERERERERAIDSCCPVTGKDTLLFIYQCTLLMYN